MRVSAVGVDGVLSPGQLTSRVGPDVARPADGDGSAGSRLSNGTDP
jgi:hypothetical protein